MRALIAVPRFESNRAILKGICVWCEENSSEFRDEESERTYQKFGICQKCQDAVFGVIDNIKQDEESEG